MKKIAALSVCLVMAASCASCGDKDSKKSKSGPDKAASDYVNATLSKKGGEKMLSLMYPDECIKELKDDGDWKDYINNYNETIENILGEYTFKIGSVEKGDEIKDLKGAESYFESRYRIKSADVSKGYEYSVKIEITALDGGDKKNENETFCVVKLDDDWKIIPCSASDLDYYAE